MEWENNFSLTPFFVVKNVKKTTQINIRMDPAELCVFDKATGKKDRSEVIRKLMSAYVDSKEMREVFESYVLKNEISGCSKCPLFKFFVSELERSE
jgi:hypothetical protein